MITTTRNDIWSKLSVDQAVIGAVSVVRINDDEFMVALETKDDVYTNIIAGFHIFNVKSNDWKLWMEYPQGWTGNIMEHQNLL